MQSVESTIALILQIILIAGFVFGLIHLTVLLPRQIDRAFRDFAAMHGLPHNSPFMITYKGMLKGSAIQAVAGIDAKTGRLAEMFHFEHEVGSGKNRREFKRTVVSLSIKSTRAHVFVNSELNDLEETPGLNRNQRYEAEGNFGKYFDMYFPRGEQLKALSLFAPDTLRLIMAEFGHYDIEVIDNILYVYTYKYLQSASDMEEFYTVANALAVALDDNSPRTLRLAAAAGNRPAHHGLVQRLQHTTFSPYIVAAVLLVIGFTIFPFVFIFDNGMVSQLFPVVFMGTIFMIAIVRSLRVGIKRRNYEKERHHYKDKTTR